MKLLVEKLKIITGDGTTVSTVISDFADDLIAHERRKASP